MKRKKSMQTYLIKYACVFNKRAKNVLNMYKMVLLQMVPRSVGSFVARKSNKLSKKPIRTLKN